MQQKTLLLKYLIYIGLIASSATLITFIPQIIKNYIYFKEPFAPFWHFKEAWSQVMYFNSAGSNVLEQKWYNPENTSFIIKTYPIAIFFGQYPMQFGNLSPLLAVALLPALLFYRIFRYSQHKKLIYLSIASLVGVAFWVIFRPSTLAPRYIMAPLLTLLPFGGFVFEQLWSQKKYYISKIAIFFALFISLYTINGSFKSPLRIAETFRNNQPFFAENIWKAFDLINQNATPDDKVIFAAFDTYPLRSDLLLKSSKYSEINSISEHEIWNRLIEKNVKWLYFDHTPMDKRIINFSHFDGDKLFLHDKGTYKITAHQFSSGYPITVYEIKVVDVEEKIP